METERNDDSELAKYHIRKRKKNKIILLSIAIIFIIISLTSIFKYLQYNQKEVINFTENSNIDYSIDLLENQYYKTNRVGENIDVIASLIRNIDVEFKYNFNVDANIDYVYSYKILANLQLKEKNKTNLIYYDEQEVISKNPVENSGRRLEIVEKMNLNYSDYDNQIKQLLSDYKLTNTESELSLTMQLNLVNKATGEKINKVVDVMKISIPLDTKTVEISVNENVKASQGEIVVKAKDVENAQKYLKRSIAMFIVGLGVLALLLRYISKTRSAEKMYEKELNKIMFDYKSYVQKIMTPLNFDEYKIVKIESFSELLQMREELQAPILMYSEKNNLKTIFMMIKDELLFTFVLSSKSIRKKLIEESKKRKGRSI